MPVFKTLWTLPLPHATSAWVSEVVRADEISRLVKLARAEEKLTDVTGVGETHSEKLAQIWRANVTKKLNHFFETKAAQ